jgi:hexosaminidase
MLDAMALHKLNVFHWHLTDDQGWRIQIRKYPRLTEIGGCRIPGGDAGIDAVTGQPRRYCGWYTQDQIRDVIAYAAERHITVVPEIDVPGHATAAISAYPELGVDGTAMPVSNQRGIHANLFNVEEEAFAFLSDVLAEVTELFPGQYVHIGADEAVKTQWQQSPRVQARMRELGIADEAALQSWFVQRLEKILAARGRLLIGWDEILEGGLPPATTVMSWRGIEGGIEAARQGHDVVMSPVSAMYLDYLQTHSPNEPAGRPKIIPLDVFYNFEPVPEALTAAERKHILGLQANMWTGDTRSFAGVEHNTFPRLAAMAETGWTPASKKNYASFLQRLPEQLHRYQTLGIGYAQTPFEVMADAALLPSPGDSPHGDVQVALSNPLGYLIRYSLDAGQSDSAWLDYQQPLRLKLPVSLRVAAFAGGESLHSVQRFDFTRASLLDRSDEELALCTMDGPVLRMEDDGPADGPRALFNVAIFEPCWRWNDAPLDGIAAVRVRAGRLPYLIQLGAEDAKRRFLPAETAHGELDIRIDGCQGQRLLTAPLPARPGDDGFITVQAALPVSATGSHDLCIRFTGDTRPAMWVLDRITLLPSKQE